MWTCPIVEVNGEAVVVLPPAVAERLNLATAGEVAHTWEGETMHLLPAPAQSTASPMPEFKADMP